MRFWTKIPRFLENMWVCFGLVFVLIISKINSLSVSLGNSICCIAGASFSSQIRLQVFQTHLSHFFAEHSSLPVLQTSCKSPEAEFSHGRSQIMSLEISRGIWAYTRQQFGPYALMCLADSRGVHDFYMFQQKALKRAFDMVIWWKRSNSSLLH